MSHDLNRIRDFFNEQFENHGESAAGVGWNSAYAQDTRFEQLLKVINPAEPFSLIEFGCGYGYLVDYLDRREIKPKRFYGLDIVPASIAAAKAKFTNRADYSFHLDPEEIPISDYLVASGVFNVKLTASNPDWTRYVIDQLDRFNRWTTKGFSVNFLTKYSDYERMAERPDLYYADPCFMFDYCKTNYARNVALLHDYEIYDFTLIVRK